MKRRVLFLCTGNSARSQMAEALLRLIAPGFEAESAWTAPAGLNPATIEAMRELGVDVSHHRSKHVDEFAGQFFDYVITVCDRAKESCPILPGAKRLLHWSLTIRRSRRKRSASRSSEGCVIRSRMPFGTF